MEEVEVEGEREGEGGEDTAPRRLRGEEDDPELQPPPPANAPPPSRSPPPVPDRKPAPQEGNSFTEYIFDSSDAPPVPPPTLDPGAEPSWAAERRDPAPPQPPPENDQQPPPPPPLETVAEGKKLAVEPAARPAATQKASRKADGKKARIVMVAPQPVRLGDVLRKLDDHFLKASEGAHEVSKMLEAARMHYHSNFADKRGVQAAEVVRFNRGGGEMMQ